MKYRFMGLTVTATLLASLAAYAGIKGDVPVSVIKHSDGTAFMSGSLGSTRNSSSPRAQMGCYVSAFAGSTTRIATCFGDDGTSVLSCSTADPAMVDTISSMSGDSLLDIEIDANGTCTVFTVQNESWIAPKLP
jgi:hypothetical protein